MLGTRYLSEWSDTGALPPARPPAQLPAQSSVSLRTGTLALYLTVENGHYSFIYFSKFAKTVQTTFIKIDFSAQMT